MFRILKYVLITGLIAGSGYLAFRYFIYEPPSVRTLSLVPKSAVLIAETDRPIGGFKELQQSELWQYMLDHPWFASTNQQIMSLDSLLKENETLADMVDGRFVTMSLHMLPNQKYDMLYLVDLEEETKLAVLEDVLKPVLTTIYGDMSTMEIDGFEILKMYEAEDASYLHIAIVDNILVLSYSEELMRASIKQRKDPYFSKQEQLTEIRKKIAGDGLLSMYLHYPYLHHFLMLFSPEQEGLLADMGQHLSYSGLGLEVTNAKVRLLGRTLPADSVDGYLKDMLSSGNGERRAHAILPASTALYTGLLFDDYLRFYDAVEKRLSDAESTSEYMDTKRRVEKWLRADLKEDLFSWIGNEIALATFISNNGKSERIVAIHARSIGDAKKGLAHLERQIRRRSPLKFKVKNYKEYEIHYLKMKGFFKLFFGELMKGFDEPYFTYIDDFVVFAQSEAALEEIIEAYESRRVLAYDDTFKDFSDQFEDEANVFSYINLIKLFELMPEYLDTDSWRLMADNEQYFKSFSPIGFSLAGDDEYFDSRFILNFKKFVEIDDSELHAAEIEDGVDSTFVNRFASGKIKEKGRYEDGKLEGAYRSYYINGNTKAMGSYREGKKSGTWYYYKRNGKLKKKETY